MTVIASKAAVGVEPSDLVDPRKNLAARNGESEKVQLRRVSRKFEAMIMYEMLKTMRKTIPENSLAPKGEFSGGLGKDIFTQMFDMQLADRITKGDRNSIADMLYRQLEKLTESNVTNDEGKTDIRPLGEIDRPGQVIPIKKFIDISSHRLAIKSISPKKTEPVSVANIDFLSQRIVDRYGSIINRAALESGLDSSLIISVIRAESAGDDRAQSPAGAKGLMQLTDSTAREMGVTKVFDPQQNIGGGTRYLQKMINRFGDLRLGLAAYNAGPANVIRYGGLPPFAETRQYVEKVVNYFNLLEGREAADAAKE